MNLVFSVLGRGGHTEVEFCGEKIVVSYHDTTPSERGMIETLVDKAKKDGLKLHRHKKGEVKAEMSDLLDVLMDKKNEIALVGEVERVEKLALDLVEKEIKNGRMVLEAQKDGTWKILKIGDFKVKKDEKQTVASTAPVAGG